MAYTTSNSSAVIWQQLYDQGLQEVFQDQLLGLGLFRDVGSMFPHGENFNMAQIGSALLKDYQENSPIDYSAVDLGRVTLAINRYKQDGFYITDKDMQDMPDGGASLFAARVRASMRAFAEAIEADAYQAINDFQTPGDANVINGQPHRRILASGATAQNVVDAIADIKLSFDKAKVPQQGRVLVLDPTLENVLNKASFVTSPTPAFQGIIETGFARNNRFVTTIHGFDIWVSNLLPTIASETIGSDTATNGVANIAMCLADDDAKPLMGVVRQPPQSAFSRNEDLKRDQWSATARWGLAVQRPESLYVLISQ